MINIYRCQLISKQDQLNAMLNNASSSFFAVDSAEEEIIEEYLDEDLLMSDRDESPENLFEVISLPNFKKLPDTSDCDAIIKLIDEIEEKNQIILECSKPQSRSKRPKLSKHSTACDELQPIEREELKFEKQIPKLIMMPAVEGESSNDCGSGVIVYTVDKKCHICDQEFGSDFQLKRHQISIHPLAEPITCCNQMFEFNRDYKKHQKSSHSKAVECPFCGKMLKNKKTFLVHKRSHQSISERKFKCSYSDCTKAFNFKLHLDNHERTHSGIKPFKCSYCGLSFKQSYHLTLHTRKHQGIDNSCSTCHLKFRLKSQLEKHKQSCNGSELPNEKEFYKEPVEL